MPGIVHITLNYVHTLCRRPVGELAGDTYTTDVIRATSYRVRRCPDYLAALVIPGESRCADCKAKRQAKARAEREAKAAQAA